eukprot:jgi/Botrbrau1/4743/Bobra.0137s0015.1
MLVTSQEIRKVPALDENPLLRFQPLGDWSAEAAVRLLELMLLGTVSLPGLRTHLVHPPGMRTHIHHRDWGCKAGYASVYRSSGICENGWHGQRSL